MGFVTVPQIYASLFRVMSNVSGSILGYGIRLKENKRVHETKFTVSLSIYFHLWYFGILH